MQCKFRLIIFRSAILQEVNFKSGEDIYEFIPWLGLSGCVISLAEAGINKEYQYLHYYEYGFQWPVFGLVLAFSVSLVCFTSVVPFYIKRSSASMFNISLVSTIFWSYLFEVFLDFKKIYAFEYYIGFLVIIVGIYLFNKNEVIYLKTEQEKLIDINEPILETRTKSFTVESHRSSFSMTNAEAVRTYSMTNNLQSKANKYMNKEINLL